MSRATDILSELLEAGGTIRLSDDGEAIVDCGSGVPQTLIDSLRADKPELVAYLKSMLPSPHGTHSVDAEAAGVRGTFRNWTMFDGPMAGKLIAFDTETLVDPEASSWDVQQMVIATAWDGETGHFIAPEVVPAFLQAQHPDSVFAIHNIGFDFGVVDAIDTAGIMWKLLDEGRVVCTQQLERLLRLAQTGKAPEYVSLSDCAKRYLGIPVEKELREGDGSVVRKSFGKYLGCSPSQLPPAYLAYAAGDVIATHLVHQAQLVEAGRVRRNIAPRAFGYVSDEAIGEAWSKYGPLSLNIQTKIEVVIAELYRKGVRIDRGAVAKAIESATAVRQGHATALREAGLFVPEIGETTPRGEKALSTAIKERVAEREQQLEEAGELSEPVPRTDKGAISLAAENQSDLAAIVDDPLVWEFVDLEKAGRYVKNYLRKIDKDEIHPRMKSLRATGRMSQEDPPLQQFPKCGRSKLAISPTPRQAIVPAPGYVFAIVDYAQLEGRSLAAFWSHQVGWGDTLTDFIAAGVDLHTALATELHGRAPEKHERDAVKALTFGIPAGLSYEACLKAAKKRGGKRPTREEFDAVKAAYKRMAEAELAQHLASSTDPARACQRALGTKSVYDARRVLRLLKGDAFDEPTASRLWDLAQGLVDIMPSETKLEQAYIRRIAERSPCSALATAVERHLNDEPFVAMSGRVRGLTKFTESRNGVFQAPAADGMILAVYQLVREGFDVRLIVHDEVVVQIPDDEHRDENLAKISEIMVSTMSQALGGVPVDVEGIVSRSWSHTDKITDPPRQSPTRHPRSKLSGTVPAKAARKPRGPRQAKATRPLADAVADPLPDDFPF